MRDENPKKSKLSWSKVRKWFNIKNKAHEFHADDVVSRGDEEWRSSFSEREACTVKKSKTERLFRRNTDRVRRGKIDLDAAEATVSLEYRIFVATWNVGGKSPPSHMNLEDWLHTSPPADVYVLGFQEIVPLNAGNVLGSEDNGPARKWVALVRRTLNNLIGSSSNGSNQTPSPVPNPVVEMDDDFEGSSTRQKNPSFFHRRSFQSLSHSLAMDGDIMAPQPRLERRYSVCDRVIFGSRASDFDSNFRWGVSSDDDYITTDSPSTTFFSPMSNAHSSTSLVDRDRSARLSRYCLVASKQMVGIFLMVWVRSEIRDDVRNLKVSCVGRGLMGYLGNKGSISISLSLHQTSFCFVCSHLTSGQKEGDELRRNSDVMEILRKTRFPPIQGLCEEKSPESILEHDRIIWLGDLNYRIALSYRSAKALVEMHNWKALLEKDQLRIEQRCGRVFEGWNEGRIYFPPTYKYSNNSDRYTGDDMNIKEKRRTPAWCDRILWYGRGLNQLSYVRGESRFSDHRPVYSVFIAEVESINHSRIQNMSCSTSQVDIAELFPYSSGYTELGFF
ncbi:type IV inositol polyphosphate 5-phosphatase 7-like isoform X2 [Ananas comosus]|uniref:Type IV inositol polyphosphate 5-phosphatase 7-like isoform X2 n=1 Tax=Ananas comosus TaxID=4615 RepID=A0A6P5FT57_ANACO|nr:type IV inositol polyphosphate 5-phosphatase 7-like isoform X2 [Ananas comosus]